MQWLELFLNLHPEASSQAQGCKGATIAVDGTRVAQGLWSTVAPLEAALLPAFDLEIERVVRLLQECGTEVHVVLEPAFGTQSGARSQELCKKQFEETMQASLSLQEGDYPAWCGTPGLAMQQFLWTLRRLKVTVEYSCSSATLQLAEMVRRGRAFSVLSTDTDFALMPGCRFTPLGSLKGIEKPPGLPVVTPDSVAACLGLPAIRLPDWAALCGNRFTAVVFRDHLLLDQLPIASYSSVGEEHAFDPMDIARFLARTALPLAELPAVAAVLRQSNAVAVALAQSQQYYAGGAPGYPPAPDCLPPPLALDDFVAGALPDYALAVAAHGEWWGCPTLRDPRVEAAHQPLRKIIYGLLVVGENHITEFSAGTTPGAVAATEVLATVPLHTLYHIHRQPDDQRTATFYTTVLQLASAVSFEGSFVASFSSQYWPACIFLWYMLATASRELQLSPSEIEALVLMLSSAMEGPELMEVQRTWAEPPTERVALVCAFVQTALQTLHELALLHRLPALLAPPSRFVDTLLLRTLLESHVARIEVAQLPGLQEHHRVLGHCASVCTDQCGDGADPQHGGGYRADVGSVQLPSFSLPIFMHRQQILKAVDRQRLTLLCGHTGCGKSSGLPLILLDHARRCKRPVRIIITQPRRVACFTLAKFVATQLDEPLGKTVGYCIHQDRMSSPETRIEYTTTGYLLELLAHSPACLGRYTHVVMDEAHERSSEADLLALVLSHLLVDAEATKLIIMSATLDAQLYQTYFSRTFGACPSPPLHVGQHLFPVSRLFLDQLPRFRSLHEWPDLFSEQRIARLCQPWTQGPVRPFIDHDMLTLAAHLVIALARPEGCVLVFLPGMAEIAELADVLHEEVSRLSQRGGSPLFHCDAGQPGQLQVRVLHSLVSPAEQQESLRRGPGPKVILATNIAESSITVPDATAVIDFALHRVATFDSKRSLLGLSKRWCSRACLQQRAGRVGRVSAGLAIHLIPRAALRSIPIHSPAELLRLPLSGIVLRVKLTLPHGVLGVRGLLSHLPEPPAQPQLDQAAADLYKAGAVVDCDIDARVTRLGSLAAALPVDLSLAHFLILAMHSGCVAVGVTLAAAISGPDLFRSPHPLCFRGPPGAFHLALLRNIRARLAHDEGLLSEPLQLLSVARQWWMRGRNAQWAVQNELSLPALRHLENTVLDLCEALQPYTSHPAVLQQLQGLCRIVSQGRGRRTPKSGPSLSADSAPQPVPALSTAEEKSMEQTVTSLLFVDRDKLLLLLALAFGRRNQFLVATPQEDAFCRTVSGELDASAHLSHLVALNFGASGAPGDRAVPEARKAMPSRVGHHPTLPLLNGLCKVCPTPKAVVLHFPPPPAPGTTPDLHDAGFAAKVLHQLAMLRGMALLPGEGDPAAWPACALPAHAATGASTSPTSHESVWGTTTAPSAAPPAEAVSLHASTEQRSSSSRVLELSSTCSRRSSTEVELVAHDEVAHDDDGDDSDGSEGFEVVAPLVDDSTCGTSDAPSESAPPECTLPPPPEAGLLALPLPPP
eukprot:EG_transcript_402